MKKDRQIKYSHFRRIAGDTALLAFGSNVMWEVMSDLRSYR